MSYLTLMVMKATAVLLYILPNDRTYAINMPYAIHNIINLKGKIKFYVLDTFMYNTAITDGNKIISSLVNVPYHTFNFYFHSDIIKSVLCSIVVWGI